MNIRKFVPILVAVALIALGVGLLSLKYNDNYRFVSSKSGNLLNINSRGGMVKIGTDGIEVRDGNDHVVVGWDGIKVSDGNEEVSVGWDGVKVKEGNKSIFSTGKNWNWFGISAKDLKWETLDEEKLAEINGVNNIEISSPFIDIKVTSADRDDIRIHYYGKMKTNVVPELKVEKISNKLNIKLEHNSNSYSVVESDVVLEVFVPKSFNGELNTTSSSGDIYMKNLIGKNINVSASSGDLELENLEAPMLNLATSSGEIILNDSIGEIKAASSSGDIFLDNPKTSENIKVTTSSGDVSIKLGDDASYKVEGTTSSGDVYYSGPISVEKDRSGKFDFTIGSGEKSIEISTSSGDIRFSR